METLDAIRELMNRINNTNISAEDVAKMIKEKLIDNNTNGQYNKKSKVFQSKMVIVIT